MLARIQRAAQIGQIVLVALSILALLSAIALGPTFARAQAPGASAGTVPLEADTFTEHVAAQLRQRIGAADTVTVRSPLTLGVGDQTVPLDSLFVACRKQPQGCADDLDNFLKLNAETFRARNTPANRESLRVMVRDAGYIRDAQRSAGGDAQTFRPRPLAGPLVVVPVFDTPRATRFLNEKDYKTLDMSADQVSDLARRNTYSALAPIQQQAKPVRGEEVGQLGGSTLQPSRLAFIDDWKPLADAQGGRLIVSVPSFDTVLYVGDDSPAALQALREATRDLKSRTSAPLTDMLLRWTPRGWDPVP